MPRAKEEQQTSTTRNVEGKGSPGDLAGSPARKGMQHSDRPVRGKPSYALTEKEPHTQPEEGQGIEEGDDRMDLSDLPAGLTSDQLAFDSEILIEPPEDDEEEDPPGPPPPVPELAELSDETTDLVVQKFIDVVSDIAGVTERGRVALRPVSEIGGLLGVPTEVGGLISETLLDDVIRPRILNQLLGKRTVADWTSVDEESKRVLWEEFDEFCNSRRFKSWPLDYQINVVAGFERCLERADNRLVAIVYTSIKRTGDAAKDVLIGLFVNSVALFLPGGPVVEPVLGFFIERLLALYQSPEWGIGVAECCDSEEEKAQMLASYGLAYGEHLCNKMLLEHQQQHPPSN